MRQGGAPPTGKWTGNVVDGVKAPEPIVLPDPRRRFAATAARLDDLAEGHPMAAWLSFLARLSAAQDEAVRILPPSPRPDAAAVHAAVEAHMPPLAADGHDRDAAWREALAVILGAVDDASLPEAARRSIAALAAMDARSVEALADGFLRGAVQADDVGQALYVAAALQVYFTGLAAELDPETLRLLPERGLCPCCGSTPVAGMVAAAGRNPGARHLHCSLCATAWNHVRAVCITCGEAGGLSLRAIEGGTGGVKAEVCAACSTYSKLLYPAQEPGLDPVADDLASLGLDLLVSDEGFARHAPNPLLLVG